MITNDSLTRSGTGCFIAVPIWQQCCRHQRVNACNGRVVRSSRLRCTSPLDSVTPTTWYCCCNTGHLRMLRPRTSTQHFTSLARRVMKTWSQCCWITALTTYSPPRYLSSLFTTRLMLTTVNRESYRPRGSLK